MAPPHHTMLPDFELSLLESVLVVAAAALPCHLYFKHYEPFDLVSLGVLLVLTPSCLVTFTLPHFVSPFKAFLATFLVYLGSLATSIAVYRLSPWHPLASYPGPMIARVTKLWLAFISLGGKQHLYLQQLHERYGDFVRIGPNEISLRDAGSLPAALASDMPKGPFWDGREPYAHFIKPMIAIRDSRDHARRRRPWSKAFNTVALKGYEEIITKRVSHLEDALMKTEGTVDMAQWIGYFAYDFMADIAFGGGSEMMAEGDVDGLWHLLEAGQRSALFVSHIPWLGRFPFLAAGYDAFRIYAMERSQIRREKGSLQRDLFYHLNMEEQVGSTPVVGEVVADGGLAIIAGSDTTSSALSNLFWLLISNPVAYDRLQAEIDALGDDLHNVSKQTQMPYLNAAINESLRLFPPVLSGTQRSPEKGTSGKLLGTHFLPEGNNVTIPFYSIHRDPRNFYPLPDAFLPERWLSPAERVSLLPSVFKESAECIHNLDAFLPFSQGPANCVGRLLAYQEMRMVVCVLLRRFQMRFGEDYRQEKWEDGMADFFVTLNGKLPITLANRNKAS